MCILWYLDCSLAFVILFRTPPPGQYFMRGEIIPSLVAAVMLSCLMAQLGPGQAPCECRAERERERERARVNITTYYSHYEPSQQRASSHTAPAAQKASVKATRNRGSGAFVTIFCEKLWVLGPGERCVCLYKTDRGCKPVKSGVKSVSIVCECWAKSKMATIETKIWIAINPKIIWMTASGSRPSWTSRHGGWHGW